MDIDEVLREERKLDEPDKEILEFLKKETKEFVKRLKEEIVRQKINADVFVGGSFARGTLLKIDKCDIDIFVRFDWKIDDISSLLERIVNGVSKGEKLKIAKIRGSRDYFRIEKDKVIFEVIPVYKIKKPREARNVTDLSYFHVNYIKRKLKLGKLANEIILAKQFCQAQRVYGAESYIQGFSGYALECLIINYKSFLKMLRELIKVEDRVVLDPEKHYENKNEVLFSLNESRLQSPIILVDPTWKERNVLAALSKETFKKFKDRAREFLKKPSMSFFKIIGIDANNLRKIAKDKKREFVHLKIYTDKQRGDIAGTKMKKFARFLENETRKYFDIFAHEFNYDEAQEADFYLVVKPKNKVVVYGPPLNMKEHAVAFRKRHKNAFERGGNLYVEEKVDFSCRKFFEKFVKYQKKKLEEMGIVKMKVK